MPNILKIKTHTTSNEVDVELYCFGRPHPFKCKCKTLYEAYWFADEVCGVSQYVVHHVDSLEEEL